MNTVSIGLLALLVLCPLMMLLMHRVSRRSSTKARSGPVPLTELRRRRGELDAEIRSREEQGTSSSTAPPETRRPGRGED